MVGVTGSAPARRQQGAIIRDALPEVEAVTLLAIMLIVGVRVPLLVAPVLTVIVRGGLRGDAAPPRTAAELFDLASPDELEPVVVALLLGVVTDYVVFFCSSLRDGFVGAGRSECPAAVAGDHGLRGTLRPHRGRGRARGDRRDGDAPRGAISVLQGPGSGPGVHRAVGLLVAITLVPAVLAILGDRVFWPPGPPAAEDGRRRLQPAPARAVALLRPGWPRRPAAVISVDRRRRGGRARGGAAAWPALAARSRRPPGARLSFVGSLPPGPSVRAAAENAQDGFAEGILSPTTVLLEGTDLASQRPALARLGAS